MTDTERLDHLIKTEKSITKTEFGRYVFDFKGRSTDRCYNTAREAIDQSILLGQAQRLP